MKIYIFIKMLKSPTIMTLSAVSTKLHKNSKFRISSMWVIHIWLIDKSEWKIAATPPPPLPVLWGMWSLLWLVGVDSFKLTYSSCIHVSVKLNTVDQSDDQLSNHSLKEIRVIETGYSKYLILFFYSSVLPINLYQSVLGSFVEPWFKEDTRDARYQSTGLVTTMLK